MRSLSIATLLTMSLALAACYGDGDRAGSARADGAASSPTEGTKGTVTKPKSLSEALAKAKSSGKNVLVYYGSTTCPWSRQMKEQTMLDSEVQAALRDFVYMRLEQGETAQEFEKRWGKQPTPTVVTLNADGEPVGQMLNGVVARDDFLAYAAWAKTGEGTQPGIATGGG